MSLRSIGFVVFSLAIALFAVGITLFYIHNENFFQQTLQFWGVEFTLIRLLVLACLISAAVPSLFFGYRLLKMKNRARRQRKDQLKLEGLQAWIRDLRHCRIHQDRQGFDSLLQQRPKDLEDPQVLWNRASVAHAAGQISQALGMLESAFARTQDPELGYALVEWSLQQDPQSKAWETLDRLLDNHPGAPRALQLKLSHLEAHGEWDAALHLLTHAKNQAPRVWEQHYPGCLYGKLKEEFEHSGPSRKLIQQIQKGLKEAPEFVPLHVLLGDVFLGQEDDKRALQALETGYERIHHSVFLDRLEDYYLERHRPEDAIQVYRRILIREQDWRARFRLGLLFKKLEMTDECLEVLQNLDKDQIRIPRLRVHLADVLARRDRVTEAFDMLRKGLNAVDGDGLYRCSMCHTWHESWSARCTACGNWNVLGLSLEDSDSERQPAAPQYG